LFNFSEFKLLHLSLIIKRFGKLWSKIWRIITRLYIGNNIYLSEHLDKGLYSLKSFFHPITKDWLCKQHKLAQFKHSESKWSRPKKTINGPRLYLCVWG
jgi:hypothetical protein